MRKTIVAVPDFTRHAHLNKVLPIILKDLDRLAIKPEDIEILIATGLHRKPTEKEIKKHLGFISNKIKISSHDYRKNHAAFFGKTRSGIPIYLNKKLKDAKSIITVGVVEPHLYAGYSGGTKVISIGLADEKTINATHHPRFLDAPGTQICSIRKNTFREFIHDASSKLPIIYSINIINDKSGRLLKIFKGSPLSCFYRAVKFSKNIFEKNLKDSFDAVICEIPEEKGANIYQASRIFNYIADTRRNILKQNAVILVKACLEEGFGKGLGEHRFMKTILNMKKPEGLIDNIKKSGCLAGEHRAYMVAKAMLKSRLGFISKNSRLYKNKSPFLLFFNNNQEALSFIRKDVSKTPKIYYSSNAFNTILIRSHG